MNITCHGCKADSGVKNPMSGFPVGEYAKRTKFIWIPGAEGGSVWLCRRCAGKLNEHVIGIIGLAGELHTYVPTLRSMLSQYLDTPDPTADKR